MAKKPWDSGLCLASEPAASKSFKSFCWSVVRFTGVSTIASTNMSPRDGERSTDMPLPRMRNWRPVWVPAGIVIRAREPSTVGTSTAPPSAAVVIGIGTRQ